MASSAKAVPVPKAPITTPPSAGPASRIAIGRTIWSSAFAWGSRSAGSSSGTIASNAGAKKAAPAP